MTDANVRVQLNHPQVRKAIDMVLIGLPAGGAAWLATRPEPGWGSLVVAVVLGTLALLLLRSSLRAVMVIELKDRVLRVQRLWSKRMREHPLADVVSVDVRVGLKRQGPDAGGPVLAVLAPSSYRLGLLNHPSILVGLPAMHGGEQLLQTMLEREPGGLPLPLQLDRAVMGSVVFFRARPELGWNAGYHVAPGVTATVCVYTDAKMDIPDGVEGALITEQMERVKSDILTLVQAEKGGSCSVTDRAEVSLGSEGQALPFRCMEFNVAAAGVSRLIRIYLRGHQGHFIKIRCTAAMDAQQMDTVYAPFLSALVARMPPSGQTGSTTVKETPAATA